MVFTFQFIIKSEQRFGYILNTNKGVTRVMLSTKNANQGFSRISFRIMKDKA